jgi:hypothetical protein
LLTTSGEEDLRDEWLGPHVRFARAADRRSPIDRCRQGPGSSRGMANSFFCFSIRLFFFVYSFCVYGITKMEIADGGDVDLTI